MIYDVIGDVHGRADKLVGLLQKLGYHHNGKFFQPPKNHQAVFIGDLIDRGHQQLQTLEIVFAMLDAKVAHAVMGNHEYNALAFATPDRRDPQKYLRQHTQTHQDQHQAFLDEVGFGSDLHHAWLTRLYELPLWLEFEDVGFVHACWDHKAMAILKPWLTQDNRLTADGLQATSYQDTAAYHALERVLKGEEIRIPNDLYFLDKDGKKRHQVRVQWWQPTLSKQPIYQIARMSPADLANIPKHLLADDIDFQLTTQKKIFIGHYWLTGKPEPLSPQVVCVDYSAATFGYLTAYRFDTQNPALSADHFVQYIHDK